MLTSYILKRVVPHVRIASLLMHGRIGKEITCLYAPYALECDFPSPSQVSSFIFFMLERFNLVYANAKIRDLQATGKEIPPSFAAAAGLVDCLVDCRSPIVAFDTVEIPTFVSCTLQLWDRILHDRRLHFTCWQVNMCVVMNMVGKTLDDEWPIDSNGDLCQLLHLDLKTFNDHERAVLAEIKYDLSFCDKKNIEFIQEVDYMHQRTLQYIADDHQDLINLCCELVA